jgi:type IV secretory pathway VirD2 relaxase
MNYCPEQLRRIAEAAYDAIAANDGLAAVDGIVWQRQARAVVAALLPVFERHFRARLLSDEAVEAMIPVLEDRAAEFFYQRADYEPDAARAALSAALDHVSGPEGGESRG